MCCCAIGCQHSTLNRLFGSWFGCLCFPGMTSSLANHRCTLSYVFFTIFLFLTFLNIHIYFIILKTYDQQFTLTTKKSLHIIFKAFLQVIDVTNLCFVHVLLHNTPNLIIYRSISMKHIRYI